MIPRILHPTIGGGKSDAPEMEREYYTRLIDLFTSIPVAGDTKGHTQLIKDGNVIY